ARTEGADEPAADCEEQHCRCDEEKKVKPHAHQTERGREIFHADLATRIRPGCSRFSGCVCCRNQDSSWLQSFQTTAACLRTVTPARRSPARRGASCARA